jgi:hypothetical protein
VRGGVVLVMTKIKSNKEQLKIINIASSTWDKDIFLVPEKRPGYAANDSLTLPVYFYRIAGYEDESQYYNHIYNLDYDLAKLSGIYIKIEDGMNKLISNEIAEKINSVWKVIERMISPSPKNIIDILYRKQVLKSIGFDKDVIILDKLLFILSKFWEKQKNLSIAKNFCIKMFSWLDAYFLHIYTSWNFSTLNPKLLFYGEASRDEAYFMLLISLLGADVLYFNSSGNDKFNEIEDVETFSTRLDLPNRQPIKPFPVSLKLKREETIAYKASTEISQILHTENGGSYKPWQFEHYSSVPCTLKTTYDELFVLWRAEARFRTGFEVRNGNILIPNVFAKISGVNSDLSVYWRNLDFLRSENKSTLFKSSVPFSVTSNYSINTALLGKEGLFDLGKVRDSNIYKFAYLRTSVQNLILDKINQLLLAANLFKFKVDQNFKFKILHTILNLEKEYLDLIQRFDFPFTIPKLVIFDNDEKMFSETDIIIIAFLYLCGFDLVILAPTGYNDIEHGLNEKYYDIHKLDHFEFGLRCLPTEAVPSSKKSLFKRFFS